MLRVRAEGWLDIIEAENNTQKCQGKKMKVKEESEKVVW